MNIPKHRVALIAHDDCKPDMIEWASFNKGTLSKCELYATGTTGRLIEQAMCGNFRPTSSNIGQWSHSKEC